MRNLILTVVVATILILIVIGCKKRSYQALIETSDYFIQPNEHWSYSANWIPGTDTARFFIDYFSEKDTLVNISDNKANIQEEVKCRKIKATLKQYGPLDKGIDSAFDTRVIYCFYYARDRKLYYFQINSLVKYPLRIAQDFSAYKTDFIFNAAQDTIITETTRIIERLKYKAFITAKGYEIVQGISLFSHISPYNTVWQLPSSEYSSIRYQSDNYHYHWQRK